MAVAMVLKWVACSVQSSVARTAASMAWTWAETTVSYSEAHSVVQLAEWRWEQPRAEASAAHLVVHLAVVMADDSVEKTVGRSATLLAEQKEWTWAASMVVASALSSAG